ncbi:cobyrinate a,c-diamide synthase [Priestia sp. GS2]|uniref:cobyrinate a,c-diamide synthase n=1 Tax=Priestia sp. GS2 TaxID=3117403 RepID=UPI002ED9378C
MSNRRIVIAGIESGVGKTTLTIGLMGALRQKGYVVQGFKCGPDYIDPTYHTAVTGRISRNIDSWMLEEKMIAAIINHASDGADISVVEGVMGFYDGKAPTSNHGSTAELSILTNSPVILVVDCSGMARSAAAIVKGFQLLSEEVNIVGVIANRVGSQGHFQLIQAAVEQECGIPVVGYLPKYEQFSMPERHLGLIPSIERGDLQPFFHELSEAILKTIDVEKIYKLAKAPTLKGDTTIFSLQTPFKVKIAVARDAAFNFYYEENLQLLKAKGAELIYFSPLQGEVVPSNIDGLYIGGGFPEEFAEELASRNEVKESIKQAVHRGTPTLAECGGFMYLTEAIVTTDKEKFEMVGVIPGEAYMQTQLAALGYREIEGAKGNFLLEGGVKAKGHEFHYSTFHSAEKLPHAYRTTSMIGVKDEGYLKENLIAGYTHFHFGSSAKLVENWINKCEKFKKERSDSI